MDNETRPLSLKELTEQYVIAACAAMGFGNIWDGSQECQHISNSVMHTLSNGAIKAFKPKE